MLLFEKHIQLHTQLEDAMGASSGPRLSGMQKQVLSLYREFLRAARSKSAEDRRKIESYVSAEFRRNSKEVDRKSFLYIEYLLRRAKKQLEQLKSPDTVRLSSLDISVSETINHKPWAKKFLFLFSGLIVVLFEAEILWFIS